MWYLALHAAELSWYKLQLLVLIDIGFIFEFSFFGFKATNFAKKKKKVDNINDYDYYLINFLKATAIYFDNILN